MNNENLNQAKNLFEEGVRFLNLENYNNAEVKFIESLNFAPGRLSIIQNLITIYVTTNQRKKLNQLLEKYENLKHEKEILYGYAFKSYFENHYELSIDICKKIIQFEQFKFSIQDLLASNYKKQKKFLEALKIYKLQLKQNRSNLPFYNIGCLFLDLGRIKTAHYYFNKSREIKSDDYTNLNNLSLSKLKLKDLKNGFILYENRLKKKVDAVTKKFSQIASPTSLNDIKDKKILIWDEQGLGDTIQFSRFVIDLLKFSKNITFVVNTKLRKILNNLNEDIQVCDYNNIDERKFDFQIPLCSLPKLLKLERVEDINFYKLKIVFDKSNNFNLDPKKYNIGLSWSGNSKYFLDQYRSISFAKFKNILNFKEINFYKLSKDTKREEAAQIHSLINLFDMGDNSLYEISNLMNSLDLVISSDTSIIHLAGILNIKSVLLLNYNSDWRWFDDTNSTIWYPSVKILKQNKFDDWTNVFVELEQILKNYIYGKKKGQ